MKNRQLIYILIPLVLIVWGLIIFKIFKQIRHSNNHASEVFSNLKNSDQVTEPDSFSLILHYRDPFLQGIVRPLSSSRSFGSLINNNSNLTSIKPQVNFPASKYSGLVINYKNKNKLGVIKIDNKDFLVKEGELIAGEKIIRLYNDSVIVRFRNIKKTILKN
jgi:hypothetical protein